MTTAQLLAQLFALPGEAQSAVVRGVSLLLAVVAGVVLVAVWLAVWWSDRRRPRPVVDPISRARDMPARLVERECDAILAATLDAEAAL